MTDFEQFRVGLTGYCYRMLGATLEAEDAVQETFLRGWRNLDRQHGNLKSWLYAIATNVCFDMLRSAQRRAVVMDISEPSAPGTPLGVPLPETVWVQPIPDNRVLDPAELVTKRESIRLAFVAALQYLPPKQRAVLILREVLAWKADEVATLLETSVASVNSALQRARTTLATRPTATPIDREDEELLARYMKAFTSYDLDTLVTLLHQDATMTMPPFTWWMRGRDNLMGALRGAGTESTCQISTFVPALRANGLPAYGQYLDGEPFALQVFEISAGLIVGSTTYLQAKELFPIFGLSER
ncbi:RNA polymerase sigma-70 factor (ECF subfamily) [Kibdelosporangium banguiense]|uniref:RNA polymerase sigma-70 factor (ECF subfamily) n=1 Tax=Kibdelosporangium banguiense TaxID=1365924 RepID=A0ABS4TKY1_9PSEU|nr:RNA polymerase subunit sigma-70 [Kibdelosporangium banguiense]MBP2324551.1 RNA polymerase sigma-70 factor (ECF subfamily) [Kibdelosporangium banguiense]